MKTPLFTGALLAFVAIASWADGPIAPPPPQAADAAPVPKLKVSDPAPVLKACKWWQGEEVNKFERGRAYMVEFWATWCGPCMAMMPDLADLQAQYKDQDMRCIALTVRDPNNTAEKVSAFVAKHGPKLKFTFAYTDDHATWDGWMTAAGRHAIPCTFVVDKTGRLVYIGDPTLLGVVAPMVVAGKMSTEEIAAKMSEVRAERTKIWDAVAAGFRTGDHKPGLQALNQFEAKYPATTNNVIHVRAKLSDLPIIGDYDEAKKVAKTVMAKAIKQNNPSSLGQVAALLRNGPGKDNRELMSVAVKAAEAAVQMVGDQDAQALMDLAETYSVAGDKAKAKECARKAVAAASGESAESRRAIEQQARKLEE